MIHYHQPQYFHVGRPLWSIAGLLYIFSAFTMATQAQEPKETPKAEATKSDTGKTENPKTEAAAEAPSADLSKGVLYGAVVDAVKGQPVAEATVALQDKDGKVIAWTKTDAKGQYAIAADPLAVLQLRPSQRRGLLAGLLKGAGKVVTAPVKVAGQVAKAATDTVKQVDPVQTVRSAAVAVATGNPAPVVAQVAGNAVNSVKTAAEQAPENAVRVALGERQATAKEKRQTLAPGEVQIVVSAPNYKDLKGKAGAYWLEPKSAESGQALGTQAWLEKVKLAPTASDKASEVENVAVLLVEPRLEPSLAPRGSRVKMSVKLQVPPEKTFKVRVFAREEKKRTIVELKSEANHLFTGELAMDPATPVGETTITIVALRSEPVEINLRESKADPLLDFAQKLDEMDAGKPYDFDPRIMASENRIDLTLTVLDPKQATPPTATPPAAPSTPPTPVTSASPAESKSDTPKK